MTDKLNALKADFEAGLPKVPTVEELLSFKAKFLGKSGALSEVLKGLKDVSAADRPKIGGLANQLRDAFDAAVSGRMREFENQEIEKKLGSEKIDVTLPGRRKHIGGVHPLMQTQDRIIDIFTRLGFALITGPEVETDFCNFEALNVPADHPARDMQDTLYLRGGNLLRTQTSAMQIRAMLAQKPPLRFVMAGAVYRSESVDATHSAMFHQLECLCVDKNITMENLKGTLEFFAKEMFGSKTKIRLRGSYFPFTEPSVEVDCSCVFCKGNGCKVCKQSGWIEILGAGMVNPVVFEKCGYPAGEYTGFALGMGIERIAMLVHDIHDLRLFYENDLRFLGQFL
ncbi:MAG TPA: phenylalanine--tRNA ligase subunit alpha [Bdellovibrionota bacterium]